MQRIVEQGEIEQGGYSSKELLEVFSCYKIPFFIFQSKKTARKHKRIEPSTLKNYECQKITSSTLMLECWLSLTPQSNFILLFKGRKEERNREGIIRLSPFYVALIF